MKILCCFIAGLLLLASISEVGAATELQSTTKKLATAAAKQTSTGSATSDFLYEIRNSGTGPLYNELLTFAQGQAKTGVRVALQAGEDAATLAAVRIKIIRDKIAKVNSAIGRLLAVVDVSNKLASEDFEGAAWSAGFTALGELAGKDGVVQALGLASAAPINAAIVALQIVKTSYDTKDKAIQSTHMETLYAAVQRVARVKGRQLGEAPGPFPVTPENIENVWQLLLRDQLSRDSFGNYVTQDLKGEWPQPGFFARLDANYFGLTTSAAENKQAQAEAMKKRKTDIRRYIASFLASLNRSALQEERRVVAVKLLNSLKNYFSQHGATLEVGLRNMEAAGKRLPEVIHFANRLDAQIRDVTENENLCGLNDLRSSIVRYVRDVLRWLPSKGGDATVDQTFKKLVAGYDKIIREIARLRKKFENNVREPEPTIVEATDARSYYKNYFEAQIKPFDWDKVGGPPVAIDKMSSALAKGQFRTSFDKEKLLAGRVDYAGSIIRAWELENYAIACGGGTTGTIEAPTEDEKDRTINGFYQQIINKLREIRNAGPNGPIVNEDWNVAYQMALAATDRLVQVSQLKYDETTQALHAMHNIYLDQAAKVFVRAKEIDNMFLRFGSQAFSPDYLGYARPMDGVSKGTLPQKAKEDPLGIEGVIAEMDATYSGFQLSKIDPISYWNIETALTDYLDHVIYRTQQEIRRITTRYQRYIPAIDTARLDMERIGEEWDQMINDAQPNVDDIRHFVDPEFMNSQLYQAWVKRRNLIDPWLKNYQHLGSTLEGKINQDIEEREDGIRYLRYIKHNFTAWVQTGRARGVLKQLGGKLLTGFTFQGATPFTMNTPYPHYLTKVEKRQILSEMRNLWKSSGLLKFSNTYAPWLQEIVNNYLQELGQVAAVTGENFLVCDNSGGCMGKSVTSKLLAEAENIVNSLSPGSNTFQNQYSALNHLIPLLIAFPGQPKKELFQDISAESLKAPLAARYVDMREKLRSKLKQHYPLLEQRLAQEQEQRALEARNRLPGLLSELVRRVQGGKKQVDKAKSFTGGGEPLLQLIDALQKERKGLFSDPYQEVSALSSVVSDAALRLKIGAIFKDLNMVSADLMNLIQLLKNRGNDATAEIRAFYNNFQKAYEAKDESQLLSYLSDDWEAGDGTTLFDVEDYFHNMFNVFDEIQMQISGLNVQSSGNNRFQVSYETLITGRIFADGLEHEEKSSVTEEVEVSPSGEVKIIRTPQGRFWYVK